MWLENRRWRINPGQTVTQRKRHDEGQSNLGLYVINVCVQAYKKLAMQWHPDKFQDEEDKKTAEKKFMDIAAAKEVLLDEGTYTYVPSVKHCIILWASVLT